MESRLRFQNRIFVFMFGAIFIIHASLMVVQVRDHVTASITALPSAIKLKLVQELTAREPISVATKKQIVQSEEASSDEKPEDKAFLSDKNRNFDRQTVSKDTDIFKKAGLGNAALTQLAKKTVAQKQKKANLTDLKLSDVGIEAGVMQPPKPSREPASLSTQGTKNGDPLALGFSSTNDYVEDVALGDFTHLNTVEYKYYGFFHRIRQKLEQFWGKSIQEKASSMFKAGRRIASNEDLITSLQITLDEKGQIIAVKILGTSGVKELDDAAIESFNQAGPFPNPPKDLLVNGKAVIEWGFVVKS
ncbi:MAG TPA: TonB family protein [Bacteriovoracaceae bacterium]|nr:TonB family protein [Bacteriovoracaceae bacterium]